MKFIHIIIRYILIKNFILLFSLYNIDIIIWVRSGAQAVQASFNKNIEKFNFYIKLFLKLVYNYKIKYMTKFIFEN